MIKKYSAQKIAGVLIPAALFFGLATVAFAESGSLGIQVQTGSTSVGASASARTAASTAKVQAKMQTAIARGDKEIEARLAALSSLAGRINAMIHVSDSTKASLSTSIQSAISSLGTLKAKIDADTDATVLKDDMLSIKGDERIYALVIPQARILAAADRVNTIDGILTALQAKFQTRISAAQASGKDVTALTAALTDMTAKAADAKVQADAAVTGVSGLTPDGGDTVKLQANQAALKAARADLQVAMSDLKAAQKDAKTIIAALKVFGEAKVSANGTVSAPEAQENH